MYSSLSGGGSVGNGAGEGTFVEGMVTLCSCASKPGRLSPAKADAADAADFFACLDRESKVLRNCSSLLAWNHNRDRRAHAIMIKLTTRLDGLHLSDLSK